jgi:chorismate lyase/3-hydroxybenzoate synthase
VAADPTIDPGIALGAGDSCALRMEYRAWGAASARRALPADALAGFTFGTAPPDDDPRWIRVGLRSLDELPRVEVWRVDPPALDAAAPGAGAPAARTWRESLAVGDDVPPCVVRGATLGAWSVGCIELDEAAYGGIEHAGEAAYLALAQIAGTPRAPHVLRIWNYLDAINLGDGDDERYRQFCAGRGAGLARYAGPQLPAATGIGRCDGERVLQVYWLAGAAPGIAIENPRQVSAWRYPRQYGPVPPRFSRAMRVDGHVFVSGTASVVGHETRHADCVESQVRETIGNLDAVLAAAGVPDARERELLLKAYVRDAADAPRLRELLQQALPRATCVMLEAEICRRDLHVEVDCVVRAE